MFQTSKMSMSSAFLASSSNRSSRSDRGPSTSSDGGPLAWTAIPQKSANTMGAQWGYIVLDRYIMMIYVYIYIYIYYVYIYIYMYAQCIWSFGFLYDIKLHLLSTQTFRSSNKPHQNSTKLSQANPSNNHLPRRRFPVPSTVSNNCSKSFSSLMALFTSPNGGIKMHQEILQLGCPGAWMEKLIPGFAKAWP